MTDHWPFKKQLERAKRDSTALFRFILGEVEGREVGVRHILSQLEEVGFTGELFLDIYPYKLYGEHKFRSLANEIIDRGHQLQLLTHPLSIHQKLFMHQLSYDEQKHMIELGLRKTQEWTGQSSIAHRAGSYGADNRTLDILNEAGITYDLSYAHNHRNCRLDLDTVNSVIRYKRTIEIPTTVYREGSRFLRSANYGQLDIEQNERARDIYPKIRMFGDNDLIVLVVHSASFLKTHLDVDRRGNAWIEVNDEAMREFEMLLGLLGNDDNIAVTRIGNVLKAQPVSVPAIDMRRRRTLSETTHHYDQDYFTTHDNDYLKYLDYLKTGQLFGSKRIGFELSRPHRGMDILEIGVGKGELLISLIEAGASVWGIEYCGTITETIESTARARLPDIDFPRLHHRLIIGNALDETVYPHLEFDRVILCATLEHFRPGEIDMLTDILVNAVKPGGMLVICNDIEYTSYHFKGHRWYGDHCTRLSNVFYDVLEQRLNGFFSIEHRELSNVVMRRTDRKDKFTPKVSIQDAYGTGEYKGLPNTRAKLNYFLHKQIYLFEANHKWMYSLLVRIRPYRRLRALFVRIKSFLRERKRTS